MANGAGRIGNLIVHSWPVQAAGLALITVLVTWAVTLFLTRQQHQDLMFTLCAPGAR
jgi:hypothetical protein